MLWRTRVTWALVGAGVTLAITSLRERSDGSAAAEAVAPEASVELPTSVEPPASVKPPASVELPTSVEPPATVSSEIPIPETDAAVTATNVPAVANPVADPFEIPLPLMPGARVMKRSQQPDEAHGGTLYTLALSVPAPGMQVESFYRSALADAKLVVTGGSREPSTIGSGRRSSLRGRGRDAIVHVNLQQRGGTLRTIVRILWRTLP